MLRRWLLYLAIVAGCTVFLIAYQGWLAWVILAAVLCLPVLGLVVSLPMMLTTRLRLSVPSHCTAGEPVPAQADVSGPLGAPPLYCRIRAKDPATGKSLLVKPGTLLPTEHCGALLCQTAKVRIYDCLGLFFRIPFRVQSQKLLIRPRPVPIRCLPELERQLAHSWRPKPGGGFAENHELRLYRPGDNLNQIHWKLSAKARKYIIREAMEPSGTRAVLSLILGGTREEMDRKLGRLLWLGRHLLEKELHFYIRALSGTEVLCLYADDEDSLLCALDRLLEAPPAAADAAEDSFYALWHYAIGGEPDEV